MPDNGYKRYENSQQLAEIMAGELPENRMLDLYARDLKLSSRCSSLTSEENRFSKRHCFGKSKSSKVHFRSFDPVEVPRFSMVAMISQITASAGIVIPLLLSAYRGLVETQFARRVSAGLCHKPRAWPLDPSTQVIL